MTLETCKILHEQYRLTAGNPKLSDAVRKQARENMEIMQARITKKEKFYTAAAQPQTESEESTTQRVRARGQK